MLNKTNILVIFILFIIGCINLPETTADKVEESPAATVDIDATVDAKVEAKIKGLTPVSDGSTSEIKNKSLANRIKTDASNKAATKAVENYHASLQTKAAINQVKRASKTPDDGANLQQSPIRTPTPWYTLIPPTPKPTPTSTPRTYSKTPTPWYSDEIFTPKPPKRTPTPTPVVCSGDYPITLICTCKDGSWADCVKKESPYREANIGQPYVDISGVTVTVNSVMQNSASINNVFLQYSLQNNTSNQIFNEGSFTLYLNDGKSMPQYGFFNELVPGQQISRNYTWNMPSSQYGIRVVYSSFDTWGTPLEELLGWDIP